MSGGLIGLRPRQDSGVLDRIALSTAAHGGIEDFHDWLTERSRAHRFHVERIPFADMDAWSFAPGTGNLVHRTGRFFSIQGLHVNAGDHDWHQPIIVQPEIGILGILVKEFDGVLHCLMQAKMEPGNVNVLQLSPTVQATRSNYTQAHRGSSVRYLEYFTDPGAGRVLVDVLQSEHGSWFFRKSNRNMVVEILGDVPEHEDFRWFTLGQIGDLLRRDNVVNMDSRTVLACLPGPSAADDSMALHSDVELVSWYTAQRSGHHIRADLIPLDEISGWRRGEYSIDYDGGDNFSVVAVLVAAGNREVTRWTQPLISPHGMGITAFLVRDIEGITHVLAHARMEGGLAATVEIAPTVQYTPVNGGDQPAPRFLDHVLSSDPAQVLYSCVHSEEGGRFLHAQSRYLLVDVGEEVPLDPPPGYLWVTPAQLSGLLRHGHYVNVEARTLVACLNALR